METGPRFIGSSDRLMRLEKPGIELDQPAVRFSHDAGNIIFKQSIGLKEPLIAQNQLFRLLCCKESYVNSINEFNIHVIDIWSTNLH